MPYGRTPEQEIMLEAHRAINFRRYYGDGRWGAKPGIYRTTGRQGGDWLIRKIKPKGIVWAKNTDMHATKVHAVRYQLQATKGERSATMTAWLCGGQAWSKVRRQSHPVEVCAACAAAISKHTTVPYSEVAGAGGV